MAFDLPFRSHDKAEKELASDDLIDLEYSLVEQFHAQDLRLFKLASEQNWRQWRHFNSDVIWRLLPVGAAPVQAISSPEDMTHQDDIEFLKFHFPRSF